MTTWSNIIFPNSTSPIMEQLDSFHDHAIMILIMITIIVSWTLISLLLNHFNNRFLMHGQLIEIIWTILPAIILLFIAFPSLHILYMMDEINEPSVTVKTMGHQWYWSYEFTNPQPLNFDSYMIPLNDLSMTHFRLLEVDNSLIIPFNQQIRLLVSSQDVIHSWTIPSLGIKMDAIPGRLNQINFFMTRPGIFSGQCSEICGINHSFMPIFIQGISLTDFIFWLTN